MTRTRTGKRIELTARDIEIFKLLERYRYLRSTYIHAFVGGASETRFKERLGDLFHEGYLDRPEQQWLFADARRQPAVYEISCGAQRALREAGTEHADTRTAHAQAPHRQFLHSVLICELLASLELGAQQADGVRFIGWKEALSRMPERNREAKPLLRLPMPSGGHLAPDGLFGIEYSHNASKTYRFFALEADRGTMPVARSDKRQTSMLGKFAAYREVIEGRLHKAHWGLPNLLVLTVTTNHARIADIISRLTQQNTNSAALLFKTVNASDLKSPVAGLLHEPWQRARSPSLRIDE